MSNRMLALATSIMMAAPLLAVPGFAQAPAAPMAPATPAPAAPATPAPATPAPATPAPAASGSSMPGMAMPAKKPGMPAGHATRMERVKKLQTALNAHGATVTVDGKMGPKTKSALMDFQKANNLKVTGMPDKETRAALMK